MEFFIFLTAFFVALYISLCIVDKIDEVKEKQNSRKWKRQSTVNSYRIHITCNNVIAVKTFTGDNYSEMLEKAINYSLKEMNGFPDVIVLKKDIIYL